MLILYLVLNSVLIALAFFSYIVVEERRKDYAIIISFLVSLIFLYFYPESLNMAIVFTATLAINSMYRKKSLVSFSLFSLAILLEFLLNIQKSVVIPVSLSIGVGVSISLLTCSYMKNLSLSNEKARGHARGTEIFRDLLQISVGVVIITLMIFWSHLLVELILVAGMLIAIFILDMIALHETMKISKLILRMERNNVKPGYGTLWFLAGLMLLISLSPQWKLVEIGVFAMAIGDSLATIGGINMGIKKLFYNRKKSIGGFMAMLIPTAIFAFIILGPSYIFVAVLATILESVSGYPLDDNFTIPSGVIIGNLILSIL